MREFLYYIGIALIVAGTAVISLEQYGLEGAAQPTAELSASDRARIEELMAEQQSKGRYVQVVNGVPVDGTLTTKIPRNVSVDTQSGPAGEGYKIIVTYPGKTVSIGVGAYAEENTFVIKTATST